MITVDTLNKEVAVLLIEINNFSLSRRKTLLNIFENYRGKVEGDCINMLEMAISAMDNNIETLENQNMHIKKVLVTLNNKGDNDVRMD